MFILLTIVLTVGCSKELEPAMIDVHPDYVNPNQSLPAPDTCSVGYWEIYPNNAHFVRTTSADTVWFKYPYVNGYVAVMWIDGSIDWSCTGIGLASTELIVWIWDRNDTCQFILPSVGL